MAHSNRKLDFVSSEYNLKIFGINLMEYVSLTALIQGLGSFPSYSIFCCSREEKRANISHFVLCSVHGREQFSWISFETNNIAFEEQTTIVYFTCSQWKKSCCQEIENVQKIGQRSSAFLLIEVAQDLLFSGLSVLLPDHSSDTESKSSNSFFRLLVKSN